MGIGKKLICLIWECDMLSDRVLATIKFFDLQDYPLTAFEVWRYLVSEPKGLRGELDDQFELKSKPDLIKPVPVHFDTVLGQLDVLVHDGQLLQQNGFYTFPENKKKIGQRLRNYRYGLKREQLIKRYLYFTRHLPFVRGISLAGSQALGLQRPTSDIDLLIITDTKFMWLARSFLTVYFHLTGTRRHGKKIANRFCLNHYIAAPREVDVERNLYKAMEYSKLRPLIFPGQTRLFQQANEKWIRMFFPNMQFYNFPKPKRSLWQRLIEPIFDNSFGLWLEKKIGEVQLRRIKQDKYIFVKDDELSFHPESKHEALLKGFFEV